MNCILMRMEKIETENAELKEKLVELENKEYSITNNYTDDKPKLAGAIVFASFMALFIVGIIIGWHWGWLLAIGICGASSYAAITD